MVTFVPNETDCFVAVHAGNQRWVLIYPLMFPAKRRTCASKSHVRTMVRGWLRLHHQKWGDKVQVIYKSNVETVESRETVRLR